MKDTNEINISCFNAREIKGKQDAVAKILSECHVLGICETWLRESDRERCDWTSEPFDTNISHNRRRGFGGVDSVVHPLLRYKKIGSVSTDRYKCLTIRVRDIDITILYMPPVARKKDEEVVYRYIIQTHISKSIDIDDLSARHGL